MPIFFSFTGISVGSKICTKCNFKLRFQEFSTGFHNFDCHTILSLGLCHYLMRAIHVSLRTFKNNNSVPINGQCWIILFLQHHVSVETAIKMLYSNENATNLPFDKIRNGFYHFCALTDKKYDFACLLCGPHPKVVIGDGNWKNTCQIPSRIWCLLFSFNK